MKRILVIGCPGAGKSYFSKKLGEILNLPVIHMDNLYWRENKTPITREELIAKLEPYLKQEQWIIDGNYHHTLEFRLKYATDVFFLNLSREECVKGIKERVNQTRDDIPWIETLEDAEELIKWTEDYESRTKAEEIALLNKNQQVVVHTLSSREEVNNYLKQISQK